MVPKFDSSGPSSDAGSFRERDNLHFPAKPTEEVHVAISYSTYKTLNNKNVLGQVKEKSYSPIGNMRGKLHVLGKFVSREPI